MVKANWNQIKVPRKQTARLTWTADHAAIVHEGATLRNGTEIPARPWVDHAAKEFDAEESFVTDFRKSGDFEVAFEAMATEFGDATRRSLESEIWEWPRTTERQNGDIVTTPGDIVDTGELRDSYKIEIL